MNGVDLRQSQIGGVIELADVPIAVVDVSGDIPSFLIVYANSAMASFSQGQIEGLSLSDLEAWTPEFLKMTMGYIHRGSILSHVPLWSNTRQAVPVHLSFYPIHGGETVTHYLVIHHF